MECDAAVDLRHLMPVCMRMTQELLCQTCNIDEPSRPESMRVGLQTKKGEADDQVLGK